MRVVFVWLRDRLAEHPPAYRTWEQARPAIGEAR